MHYQSTFMVSFDAPTDVRARAIAAQHHQVLRDGLRIEGADHPWEIALSCLQNDGRDILDRPKEKAVWHEASDTSAVPTIKDTLESS